MSMRHSTPILFVLFLAAAACEHPTAPEARAAVEKTEIQLASGDYTQLAAGMSTLFDMAAYYAEPAGGGRFVPTAFVPVVRDARKAPYRATIVERVYLPPDGSGGRPFSRFTLVAWNDPDPSGRRQLVAMFTSDSVSELRVPGEAAVAQGAFGNTRRRSGFALTVDQADRRTWFGTQGRMLIRTAERTGDCPYAGEKRHSSHLRELQDDSTAMCEARRYDASLIAFIERGDPSRRGVLAPLAPVRGTLRIEEASVPGVRILTKCKGTGPGEPFGCFDRWSFWRSDDQFAPRLGVRLDSMRLSGEHLVQVLDSGSGPDYRLERGGYDVPLSYVVRRFDGTVLHQRDRATPSTDAVVGPFLARDVPQRIGARYRFVVSGLIAGERPLSMQVVELTFPSW